MYLINCPLKPATGTSDPAAIFGANLTAWYKADTGVYKDAGTTLAANNDIATYFNSSELSIQAISLATNYRLGVVYNGANSAKTYVNNTASTAATHSAPNFGANGALRVGAQFAAVSVTAAWDGPILEV